MPDDELIGQTLAGKYQVLASVGSGGMGCVYKVRQIFLDETLAIKLLAVNNLMSGVLLRRFQVEAKAARSLDHPNLVKVHDFGVLENDQPYLVMDYLNGTTLADYLRAQGPLSIRQAKELCTQLCLGLAHAHEKGIVHRDIKPSNIILLTNRDWGTIGSVKIVDFGIAKVMTEEENSQPLTRTGEIFGSPYFMSPEQCLGAKVDHRSDIYSLGCVLFESLTGTPPFVGANSLRTMVLHETSPIPSLKEASLSKDFPETLEKVVAKMLAKTPDARYQTTISVLEDLNAAEPAAREITSTSEKRKTSWRSMSVIIVTALLGFTAAITGLILKNSKSPVESAAVTRVDDSNSLDQNISSFEEDLHNASNRQKSSFKSDWNGQPIVSKTVWKGAQQVRRFVFPAAPIGLVTTELLRESKNNNPIAIVASGIKDLPSGSPLTLAIDFDRFPQGLSDDYKYIGVKEFYGLHFKAAGMSELMGDAETVNHQKQFMLDVLSTAKKWKDLHAVYLENIALDDDWLNALDKLLTLDNLLIYRPSTGFADLKDHQIFHSVRRVWLEKTAVEPFTKKIRGSSELEHLVILNCSVTAESIDNLTDCTALKHLHIATPALTKSLLEHICGLEQVKSLNLTETDLAPDDVKLIFHKMNLNELVVSFKAYRKLQASGFSDSRLVGLPPESR